MKHFFLVALLIWSVGAGQVADAQQFLCERQLQASTPRYQKPAALLRLAPDSLRLVGDYFPNGSLNGHQARVQRLNMNACDTLLAGPSVLQTSRPDGSTSVAATNRRGQVLVAQVYRPLAAGVYGDSGRIVLALFNRNGTLRWRRVVPPQARYEGISGLIEAPSGGFYACGAQVQPNNGGATTTFCFE